MAIPIILKGDTPKPIQLALKEGYDYSGCSLLVEFCGVERTFDELTPGGSVALGFTADETAAFPLGTSKVMLSLRNGAGTVRHMPWAKVKVTDCPEDVYEAAIHIDPTTLNVDDLTSGDSLGTVKSRLNAVLSFLRGLACVAVCLSMLPMLAAYADVAPLYTTPNAMPGDAPLMTNTEEYVEAKVAEAGKVQSVNSRTGDVVIAASDVGAVALSELVCDDFSAGSAYEIGDVVRHDGRAYRANTRKTAGLGWQSWMWDEVTNVQEAMEGALRGTFLKLGPAGTNTESEIRITSGRESGEVYPQSYFYLKPSGFGNRVGGTSNGWDFDKYGFMEFNSGTGYRRILFDNIIADDRVKEIDPLFTTADKAKDYATSPYYVHSYLTNNYRTATETETYVTGKVAAATATLVPETRTVNGAALSSNIVLNADMVGAMSADAKVSRLYNGGGSRYISGDGSVYSQNAEERWSVEFNGETYDFIPHFGLAPNYWECSDFVGGLMASLYYEASDENWVLDIGTELWIEGTASDSSLDFQLGTAHFICTRYSTGTTFSYETRLAYTNDIPAMPDVDGATNALAQTIPNNITRTGTDATLVHCEDGTCTNAILYIRQATHSLAGLMTAADKTALNNLKDSAVTYEELTNTVNAVKELHYDEVLNVTWETRMVGGEMKIYAVTNANVSVLGE